MPYSGSSTAEDLSAQLDSTLGLSVVVPVYDEVDSLPQLCRSLLAACEALDRSFELIFVDDGSRDGSGNVLDTLAADDARISVVHFRRNFGKSSALAAGFARVRGEIVVTLDADMQDDPDQLPAFVERIDAGADLVSGWKKRRRDPWSKRLPSLVFNLFVGLFSGVSLRDFNCGFKAYHIECIRELRVYGGLHRFLPVLAAAKGFAVEELVVTHRPRVHGVSKYGLGRFVAGFFDLMTVLLVTRFRTRPLHFFGLPGLGLSGGGIAILSYLSWQWAHGVGIGGRPLLLLGSLLLLAGIQLLCVGLLGELLVDRTLSSGDVYVIDHRRRTPRQSKSAKPPALS